MYGQGFYFNLGRYKSVSFLWVELVPLYLRGSYLLLGKKKSMNSMQAEGRVITVAEIKKRGVVIEHIQSRINEEADRMVEDNLSLIQTYDGIKRFIKCICRTNWEAN